MRAAASDVQAMGVVIPARDEEELLPRCLDALHLAVARVAVPVHVAVVLDRCRDGSAAVVAARSWLTTVSIDRGNVGRARRTGVAEVLRWAEDVPLDRLWLATTDADSVVPAYWLTRQLDHAAAGWEVVVGTVAVEDWSEQPPEVAPRWAASYRSVEHHPHVHGANLGCTAAAYVDAGGWPPLARNEDVGLLAALSDRRMLRTATLPVVTSARRVARATGGFAAALDDLAG